MQKIYVLLRHDKQTGPYNLQEIIQFDLKPYDLIWIEGQSAGWYYPQEIAALHPYLSFLPKKSAVAVQTPPEKKAAVQQPPVTKQAPPTAPSPEPADEKPAANYKPFAPASQNLEEAVYAQFRKPAVEKAPAVAPPPSLQKKGSPNAVVVGITTVVIVGGVFALSWLMNRQPAEEKTITETASEAPAPSELTPAVATDDNTKKIQTVSFARKKQKKNGLLPTQTTTAARQAKQENKKESHPADEATGYEMTGKTAPDEPAGQMETASSPEETATVPQEKKKSLKDKLLDLFRKKPEAQKEEESRPAENTNGERIATRREMGLTQLVHLRFDVPNDWMMGIKGAKATLVNRSSEKIKSATVEVLYYNDDNELLQKKVVTFGKIDAKESATIPIPDHPTATKVDYQVLSVNGAGQPPA